MTTKQNIPVAEKVGCWVHLVLKSSKLDLAGSNFSPCFLEPSDGGHVEASNNGHQGIEVGKIDAISRHFDPELDGFDPPLGLAAP